MRLFAASSTSKARNASKLPLLSTRIASSAVLPSPRRSGGVVPHPPAKRNARSEQLPAAALTLSFRVCSRPDDETITDNFANVDWRDLRQSRHPPQRMLPTSPALPPLGRLRRSALLLRWRSPRRKSEAP